MVSSFLRIHEGNQELKEKLEENKRSYTFPFPLDNFQEAGCVAIEKQENVLITAHTGSGKTVLALYGIGWALKNNKKVIYTSPIKSLSNQKYYEFMQNFGMDSTVGLMTGDIKINSDAQIMIMTTEILRNLLYKDKHLDGLKSSNLIDFDEVGVIIMDEVHYINDPDRGKVWEEVLLMSRPEFTLIMLSATLDKPEVFGSWIGELKKKPIHLIKTSHRVVPLKHYFFKDTEYEDEEGKKRLKWNYVEICNNHHVFKNYDKKIKEVSEKVKLVGIGFSFRQLHSEIALVNGAFIRLIKAFCNSLQHREKLCESSLLDEETSELKRKLLKLELSKWAKKACKKDPSLGDEGFIGTFMKKVERGIDEILELDLEENREFFEKRGSSFEEKWIHIQRIRFFKDYREKLEELLEERLQYLPVLIYSPSKSLSEKTAHQRCHEASYYYFGN